MNSQRELDTTGRRSPCRWLLLAALGLGIGSAVGAAAASQEDDQRAALLSDPRVVEPAIQPEFGESTPEELRGLLKVISARTYAFYGFNNPELQLHLPAVDNSTYARIEMPPPRLIDAAGRDVEYALERGLHDPETQIAEIRFLDQDGESPADFARMVGEISLLYPLVVESRSVTLEQVDPGVRIDGPFVEIVDGSLPDAAPFSPFEALRAYDAEGRQLKRALYSSTRWEDEHNFRILAFHGAVARVEVDTITRSIELRIHYDVPISDPLPQRHRGAASVDERAAVQHSDSRVRIDIGAREANGRRDHPAHGPG